MFYNNFGVYKKTLGTGDAKRRAQRRRIGWAESRSNPTRMTRVMKETVSSETQKMTTETSVSENTFSFITRVIRAGFERELVHPILRIEAEFFIISALDGGLIKCIDQVNPDLYLKIYIPTNW